MSKADDIIEAIRYYQPQGNTWRDLDTLLEDLWIIGEAAKGICELFGIFERFPEQDGNGVFWTVLHGLESLANYEIELVASLRRQPTEFTVLMVKRILNTGQTAIGGISSLLLLEEVINHPEVTAQAREYAIECTKCYQCS